MSTAIQRTDQQKPNDMSDKQGCTQGKRPVQRVSPIRLSRPLSVLSAFYGLRFLRLTSLSLLLSSLLSLPGLTGTASAAAPDTSVLPLSDSPHLLPEQRPVSEQHLLSEQACLSVITQVTLEARARQPDPSEPQLSAEAHYWRSVLQALQPMQTRCYNSAAYLAYLGGAQLRTGYLAAAQDTLERALMFNPQHGQALADYAQVLWLQGELFAALDLSRQLTERSDLPQPVAQRLQQRHHLWQRYFSRWDISLALSRGYDSNLNNAADLQTLTLSGGLDLTLEIADESQPASGYTLNTQISARHSTQQIDGRSDWQFNLLNRDTTGPYDQQQLELFYRRSTLHQSLSALTNPEKYARDSWRSSWALATQTVSYNRRHAYQGLTAEASLSHPVLERCQLGYILQTGLQYYPIDTRQNALDTQIRPALDCMLDNSLFSVYIAGTYNHALKQRAGGERSAAELGVSWRYRAGRNSWELGYRLTQTEDSAGYSPLLNDNQPRRTLRHNTRLQYSYSLTPEIALTTEWQQIHQSSNLPLFAYTSNRAELGLRITLP